MATTTAIPQRVHLIGVGGMHMSGIAQILVAQGHLVSGSDLQPSPLTDRLASLGVAVFDGHRPEHVGEAELVVRTSAAPDDNPEVVEARRRGVPVIKRAEMVARLMEGRYAIAVAGSHGKTTTSGLIAYMLVGAGLSPTYLVGGEMRDLNGNAAPGEGRHIVVEADEFDAAFLNYRPDLAVVTNIEPDHLDYYGSFEKLTEAFARFMAAVPPAGHLVVCADSPTIRELLDESSGRIALQTSQVISYGLQWPADWTVYGLSPTAEGGHEFLVARDRQPFGGFSIRLPGEHNVANALAAIAAGSVLGLTPEVMREALAGFRGVRRRFEVVGEAAGVTVMDDYAHHPTEVRATLAAARQRFPERRLLAVFQPHTYSRTRYLLEGFRECFDGLEWVFILETYAAREPLAAGMGAQELAEAIERPRATYVPGFEAAAQAALEALRPGDVFFTIGAGDVDQLGPMVLKGLKTREQGSGDRASALDPCSLTADEGC